MGSESSKLEEAISLVDKERAYLREERRAYEAFREQVRLVTPDSTDTTVPSETTEGLLTAYRDEVKNALDHGSVYEYSLAEDLEIEFSPSIAQVLLSKEPLTQRRKRDLLVETTAAIERRQEFRVDLDDERASLATFKEELSDIENSLEKLPACLPREQLLEKLLVVWERYDTLLERCEQLLDRRQQQIQAAERSVRIFGEKHARNEFLYNELDTQYPILSEIAATCKRIDAKQNGEQYSQTTHTATSVLN